MVWREILSLLWAWTWDGAGAETRAFASVVVERGKLRTLQVLTVLTGGVRARAGREGAARGGGPSVLLRRVVCACCAAAFLMAVSCRLVPKRKGARTLVLP